MNVETLEVDPAEAKAKLKAYRKQLHRLADDEYAQAAAGYAEMAKGRKLIHLSNAIAAAPTDNKGRPMLAIARADRKQVKFLWSGSRETTAVFDCSKHFDSRWNNRENLIRFVQMGRRPMEHRFTSDGDGYALVPMVPADAREEAGNPQLSKCWILVGSRAVGRSADRRDS